MKKLMTLVMVVVLVLSMGVCAFGAVINAENGTGETTATYTENQTFVVTIPWKIEVAKKDATPTPATVSAANVKIPSDKTLKVMVASYNAWELRSEEGGRMRYGLYADGSGSALASGNSVLEVESGNETGSASLTAQLTGEPTQSGEFTDWLTFTVKVVNTAQ